MYIYYFYVMQKEKHRGVGDLSLGTSEMFVFFLRRERERVRDLGICLQRADFSSAMNATAYMAVDF